MKIKGQCCALSLLGLILWGMVGAAGAHDMGEGVHLELNVDKRPNQLVIEITLQELLAVFAYDQNQSGRLEPEEYGLVDLSEVKQYALNHLTLNIDGQVCDPKPSTEAEEGEIKSHPKGDYLRFHFISGCAPLEKSATLQYQLFFDQNPYHQGTWSIIHHQQSFLQYFWEDETQRSYSATQKSPVFVPFLAQGIHHILVGVDHILFLLSLLIVSVLVYSEGKWQSEASLKRVMLNVVKIVTAFTLAHSITLCVSMLGWVPLPPMNWVESLIAVSVIAMALSNFRPFAGRYSALIVFGFGLIHGFGFARALLDNSLEGLQLFSVLVAFNLGVEIGQLMILIVIVPVLYEFRQSRFYVNGMHLCSFLIASLGAVWLIERSLGFSIIGFN